MRSPSNNYEVSIFTYGNNPFHVNEVASSYIRNGTKLTITLTPHFSVTSGAVTTSFVTTLQPSVTTSSVTTSQRSVTTSQPSITTGQTNQDIGTTGEEQESGSSRQNNLGIFIFTLLSIASIFSRQTQLVVIAITLTIACLLAPVKTSSPTCNQTYVVIQIAVPDTTRVICFNGNCRINSATKNRGVNIHFSNPKGRPNIYANSLT